MHAYLITGEDAAARLNKAKEILKLREEIITLSTESKHLIEDIRLLQRQLSISPFNPQKGRGVIIENSHLLTADAANAFLKTLEEPPGNTVLALTAPNSDLVLPTILSRTQLINLGLDTAVWEKEKLNKAQETLENIIRSTVGERLSFLETINDREGALEFCLYQILVVREKINSDIKNQLFFPLLKQLEQTRKDLGANVNVKAAISELLLNYPKV